VDCLVIWLIEAGFHVYQSLPRGHTDICGSGVRAGDAWRVCPSDTRHGTVSGLDADTCFERERC
jgi:hypothetical protein